MSSSANSLRKFRRATESIGRDAQSTSVPAPQATAWMNFAKDLQAYFAFRAMVASDKVALPPMHRARPGTGRPSGSFVGFVATQVCQHPKSACSAARRRIGPIVPLLRAGFAASCSDWPRHALPFARVPAARSTEDDRAGLDRNGFLRPQRVSDWFSTAATVCPGKRPDELLFTGADSIEFFLPTWLCCFSICWFRFGVKLRNLHRHGSFSHSAGTWL